MAYSKSAFAKELGISGDELKKRARSAGFDTTEDYYNSGQWNSGTTGGGGYQSVMNKQVGDENAFLSKYSSVLASQPKISDIFNRLSQEKGLTPIREQARSLQSTYEAIPEQEKIAGKQFGISSSRLGRRVAERQASLAPTVQRAQQQEQNVSSDIAEQLALQQAEQDRALKPLETEASLISNRLASAMTGFTSQAKNQLDLLITNLTTKGKLNEIEKQKLADLALKEDAFEKEKKMLEFQKKLGVNTTVNRPDINTLE